MILFFHLVHFLYSLSQKTVASNVSKMCRTSSCKKTCEVLYKCILYFLHFWFLSKYLCIITYTCEKSPPFRFYVWKITKIKSLNLVLKKGTLIVNIPPSWIHFFIKYVICTHYSLMNKNDHGWDSLPPCEFNFTFNSPHDHVRCLLISPIKS
jgi:hypothetical protein